MIDLQTFASAFPSESDLRAAIADLLPRLQNAGEVKITHGAQEYGKDIVFRTRGPLLEAVLCACVIKNCKITGAVDSNRGAMTVLNQVKQCLGHPYVNAKGEPERVGRVYVMSPQECSPIAMNSITGELQERGGQLMFVCGKDLLDLFEAYLPGFLLLQSGLLGTYLSSLKQSLEEDTPLAHLAFRHGILAKAKKITARAYVRPRFHKELAEFDMPAPRQLNGDSFNAIVDKATIKELQEAIRQREVLISSIAQAWEAPLEDSELFTMVGHLSQLHDDLDSAWEAAYSRYKAKCRSGDVRPLGNHQVALKLTLEHDYLSWAQATTAAAEAVISDLRCAMERANSYARAAFPNPLADLCSSEFLAYAQMWDAARPDSSPIRMRKGGAVLRFSEDLLDEYGGDLLITAPAGYGKTSFCKWSALHDGQRFASGEAVPLPVYVPLHQFTRRQLGSFEEVFLKDAAIAGLAKVRTEKHQVPSIRLYLDGLDEVPPELQRRIIELARSGAASYSMHVIVTARDHVFGPWLGWLPRLSLSELSEDQVNTLVTALLDGDASEADKFFSELAKVPVLRPLMKVPLLGTLVVAVYRNITALPEGKAELYRIFVDLLCGGWDMAKGVKRNSDFGSALKLRVLMRLASTQHEAKARVGTNTWFRNIVKETAPVLLDSWESLLGDIVQDGMLSRNGSTFAFPHLSFQEYLAARDLADPGNSTRDAILFRYLDGDDWWSEVMGFYVALSKRPRDMERWLMEGIRTTERKSRRSSSEEIRRRAQGLREVLMQSSPGYVADVLVPN
jgi:hypothetical protein